VKSISYIIEHAKQSKTKQIKKICLGRLEYKVQKA